MPASTFRFVPAAERELDKVAHWYEERREGLGLEFLSVVREKVFALMGAPNRWRIVNGTRRAILEGFPYAVVYREVSDEMRSKSSRSLTYVASRSIGQIGSWLPNNGLKQMRISLRSTHAA